MERLLEGEGKNIGRGETMGDSLGGKREKRMEREMWWKEREERNSQRGTGREPQTETKAEGEKAPPLRSFSVLLALACVKCKAAG